MSTLEPGLPLPADVGDDDDVAAELETLALSRRRKLPRVTLALTVALVGAGAFIGGAEAQKHLGSTSNASSGSGTGASSFASRFRGGGTATGGTSGASAFGGATIGTVTAIKGSTLYVTDASGNTVKVTTSAATQVSKTVSGTVKSVLPGNTVVIRGTAAKGGTIAATTITLGGAGAAGFGGGATGFGGGANSNSNGGATGFGGGSSSSSKGG
jgi:hypothetical protein